MTQIDLAQMEKLLYLFVGVVVLTLVGLIGYVAVASRRKKAKTTARAETDSALQPPLPVNGGVMCLVRDEVDGALQVDLEGVRYRSLAEVQEIEVKRKIVGLAMDLVRFTGVLGQGSLEPASLAQTHTWRESLRQGSQEELQRARSLSAASGGGLRPPPAPEEVEEQFLSLLTELGGTLTQLERPNLVDSIQRRLQPKPLESDRPRTFVDDIDAIVQRRVQLIPALQGRGLHVRPGPAGKVLFVFEGREYQNVDAVPNLTARQLVKDAIQEWDETT